MQEEFNKLQTKMLDHLISNPDKKGELAELLFTMYHAYNQFSRLTGEPINHKI